jgi:hypothetical protein
MFHLCFALGVICLFLLVRLAVDVHRDANAFYTA